MAFDCEVPKPEDRERLLIQKARDRVSKGWCQRAAYDERNNGVCMMGAFLCAIQNREVPVQEQTKEVEEACNRLSRALGFANMGEVIRFNDWSATTKRDVLARFDAYLEGRIQAAPNIPDYMNPPVPMFVPGQFGCQCAVCKANANADTQMAFYEAAYAAKVEEAKFKLAEMGKPYDLSALNLFPLYDPPKAKPDVIAAAKAKIAQLMLSY
jgi:hypothetical protein